MRVGYGLLLKGYSGEVPAMKLSSDKRVRNPPAVFSYRADVNFRIAVALACLHKRLICTNSGIWSQLLRHKVVVG